MPVLPNVAKVIRFSLQFTHNTNTRIFVHCYYQYSGTLSLTDLTTVTNTVITAFKNNILTLLSASLSITNCQATDLSTPSSPQVSIATSGAGGVATTANPAGTAMVVTLKIARRYRGGHPRVYVPGTSNAQNLDAEHWTSTAIANMSNGFVNFDIAVRTTPPAAVGTLTAVSVSYFTGFTVKTGVTGRARNVSSLRGGGPVVDTITNWVTNSRVASQRRRNQQSL